MRKFILLSLFLLGLSVVSFAQTPVNNQRANGVKFITTAAELSNHIGACTVTLGEVVQIHNTAWPGHDSTLKCVGGFWRVENDGMSPADASKRSKGVLVHVGDSNTNGRPSWRASYQPEWLSTGGIFEGWTSYNIGQNGSTLQDWANIAITNADNPLYSSLPAADYNLTDPGDGRLARVLNANPDVIVLKLGTNDENSPTNRGSIGQEATVRTNLNRLVNFLLIRTHSAIILRIPAPFEPTDFSGITQWVNAAEAAEASRRLRDSYLFFKNRYNRVLLYNTHAELYGNSCNDRTVNAQDPYIAEIPGSPLVNNLIFDSLHESDLGSRREAQQIAMLLRGDSRTAKLTLVHPDVPRDAVWSASLRVRVQAATNATSATFDTELSPELSAYLPSWQATPAGSSGLQTTLNADGTSQGMANVALPYLSRIPFVESATNIADLASLRQIINVPMKSGLFAYSHATRTTVQLTNLTLSSIVTAGAYPYVILQVTGANLTGFGGGLVTFYTTDPDNVPFTPAKAMTGLLTTTSQIFAPEELPFTLRGGISYRFWTTNNVTVTVYLCNQIDKRYVTGTETFNAPGKPVGTFTHSGFSTSQPFVFDATNYPAGTFPTILASATQEYFNVVLTAGTTTDLNGGARITLRARP